MSKLIPTHNGLESDSVNGPINVTTGLQVDGVDIVPAEGVASPQTSPSSVTTTAAGVSASGDLDGADTVDEAALEAALLAQETELGLLKDDVEALATAVNAIITKLETAGIFTA
jgi:hypothetical protein